MRCFYSAWKLKILWESHAHFQENDTFSHTQIHSCFPSKAGGLFVGTMDITLHKKADLALFYPHGVLNFHGCIICSGGEIITK